MANKEDLSGVREELAGRMECTAAFVQAVAEDVSRLQCSYEREALALRAAMTLLSGNVAEAVRDASDARRETAETRLDLELAHERQDRLETDLARCRAELELEIRDTEEAVSNLERDLSAEPRVQQDLSAAMYLDLEAEEVDDIEMAEDDDGDDADWVVDYELDDDDE